MDKRELILEATLKLILQGGFYHLNMKKVAQESGVAAGTIYLYFASKEQLIVDLYRAVVQRYLAAIMSGYEPDRCLEENIRAMTRKYLLFYLERPDCFSFLLQYGLSPFVFKNASERQVLLQPLLDLVEQARASGVMKDLPPHVLVALVSGPIVEMVRLWQEGTVNLLEPALQQQVLDACWQSVAP